MSLKESSVPPFFCKFLSWFSRIHIYVGVLTVLFACVKRLGLALTFGFKFPVGGTISFPDPAILDSSGRNVRLWDNPLPEARNPG
jgi:phage tail protein X